jgi:helicase
MAFKGVFIGVDRYSSPRIPWLTCCVRDAQAMHALFSDNLGGSSQLLINENATLANIKSALEDLSDVKSEDIVVIYYSGHGSDTHEIATYDANLARLEDTALPLSVLLESFKKIPAKKVVCILDCCFSGGMGAKCLEAENKPKAIKSGEEMLEQLSGEGRIIITASSVNQLAWENSRVGHGYLTYYLIEGLKGVEEVMDSGKVALYKLFEYASSRVTNAAASIGKEQHPNTRSSIDKAFYWPVFTPGALFQELFPETKRTFVTSEVSSLEKQGFAKELTSAWSSSIPSLNQLQIDAINDFGIFDGKHIVVSAPTSSGKTMIGELAALNGILKRQRTIFLFPLKALVNDKQKHFDKTYSLLGYRTIKATGEETDDIPFLMRGQYDICLMTYEKFTALILANPYLLEKVGTIVIDEVQMIADKNRGTNLEFILTLLKVKRKQGIEPQLIALSAVIGDTNGLEHWLDARLLRRIDRPVPVDEGIITADGSFRYVNSETKTENTSDSFVQQEPRKGSSQDWVVPLVRKLVSEGKQVIVFREKTGEAKGTANYLAESLGLPPAKEALEALPKGDPTTTSEVLKKCLEGGVALHNANLSRDERLAVEEYFRAPHSKIRVIAATTTLAMGINTPAEAVIIVGLQHPGPSGKSESYSVAEYKNMVGRAGRLGFVERGSSYLLALTSKEENDYWNNYILGEPEDLVSRFLSEKTDPRSLIIKVLVSAKRTVGGIKKDVGLKAQDIIDFLEGSFGAFLQKKVSESWNWDSIQLADALNNLESHGLVKREADDTYHLTELGWIGGHGGIEVESVTRLVDILRPVDKDQITDTALIAATQVTLEIEDTLFPVNGNGTKEFATWSDQLNRQSIPNYILGRLSTGEAYDTASRFKKTAACLLWITEMPFSDMEAILTKHGGSFDGVAGPIRRVTERVHDVLGVTAAVAEQLHPGLDLSSRLFSLLVRLEIGMPSAIIEVGKICGTRITRDAYQALVKADLTTFDKISKVSDDDLLEIIGKNKEILRIIREGSEKYQKESEDTIRQVLIPIYLP